MSKLKIISGGQTGVDQAALRAAETVGIDTGGTAPLGWLTENGPRPDFAELYGMVECREPKNRADFPSEGSYLATCYRERTMVNVRDSRTTLWYGLTGSRGYKATYNATMLHGKGLVHADYYGIDETIAAVEQFAKCSPLVINCAGSRESGNPGIGAKAEAFWAELFIALLRRFK